MRVLSAVRSLRVRVVLSGVVRAKWGACWPTIGGVVICMVVIVRSGGGVGIGGGRN